MPFAIAADRRSEFLDDAHGLVPDREAACYRIFALEYVHVGPANRRRRDPHERVKRTDLWNALFTQDYSPGLYENSRSHHGHDSESPSTSTGGWVEGSTIGVSRPPAIRRIS